MNPILHDLHNKQWVWTAANAKHKVATTKKTTGYKDLDEVLTSGFPAAGMIHLDSPLGCGEMRLMLSIIKRQQNENDTQKLFMFINPPFVLNAEFLLEQNILLSQLIVVNTATVEEALWSAEQCAKSGACCAVFMWQHALKHIQIRKLEHAAQKGHCYCMWLHNHTNAAPLHNNNAGESLNNTSGQSNLPLSLSLSVSRQSDSLCITVNKQKIGWAQKAIKIPFPFNSRTHHCVTQRKHSVKSVVSIKANS